MATRVIECSMIEPLMEIAAAAAGVLRPRATEKVEKALFNRWRMKKLAT